MRGFARSDQLPLELVRHPLIIRIEKGDKQSSGGCNPRIPCRRYALVALVSQPPYPTVVQSSIVRPHHRRCRSIVNNDDFPLRATLREYSVDRTKQCFGAVEKRDYYTNIRPVIHQFYFARDRHIASSSLRLNCCSKCKLTIEKNEWSESDAWYRRMIQFAARYLHFSRNQTDSSI